MSGGTRPAAGTAATDTVRYSDEDLARLVEDHFHMQVLALGHITPRGEARLSDHAVLAHCGVASVFNRATALDLEQPDLAIADVQRFFGELPHALWLLASRVTEDTDALLRGRGYAPLPPLAGMARRLPATELPVHDGHHARLFADPSLAASIAEVASASFGFGVEDRLVFEDLARNVLRHARPFNHGAVYGHREGERVRSVGLLLCTAELAGLSTIATLPSHRHRGLASAVIARALHDAAALGYHAAGVVTNPDSGRLMLSLGFRPVSTYRVYRQVRR